MLLPRSRYTVNNTKDLIVKATNEKVPQNYKMVLFDVKSLLTFVPLEYIINIIIKRIFEDHEIIIFTKSEMKNLLILRTKTVHFSFNKEIYVQIDGGTWLSPLRHVIIMAELPKLKDRQTVQTFRR